MAVSAGGAGDLADDPGETGAGGHCLLLAAMPLCMTGLCWLLPGRGLRLWSLILAVG